MRHALLLLLTLPLLAVTCETSDPPAPENPVDQLPPATQTGEYTFGCLVNGAVFVPETSTDITAIYQGGVLQMGGEAYPKSKTQGLGFVLRTSIIQKREYQLVSTIDSSANFNEAEYDASHNTYTYNCRYEYEDLIEGTLTITHFDSVNYIISGTFAFTTATEGCDTIRVTDGRFDIPYIP